MPTTCGPAPSRTFVVKNVADEPVIRSSHSVFASMLTAYAAGTDSWRDITDIKISMLDSGDNAGDRSDRFEVHDPHVAFTDWLRCQVAEGPPKKKKKTDDAPEDTFLFGRLPGDTPHVVDLNPEGDEDEDDKDNREEEAGEEGDEDEEEEARDGDASEDPGPDPVDIIVDVVDDNLDDGHSSQLEDSELEEGPAAAVGLKGFQVGKRKAACHICKGELNKGDLRFEYRWRGKPYSRFLHLDCCVGLPDDTRRADLKKIRRWKADHPAGSAERLFLEQADALMGGA